MDFDIVVCVLSDAVASVDKCGNFVDHEVLCENCNHILNLKYCKLLDRIRARNMQEWIGLSLRYNSSNPFELFCSKYGTPLVLHRAKH